MPGPKQLHARLGPAAAKALDKAMTATGHTQTDTVNRAIEVYARLVDQAGEGVEFLTRRPGSRAERLHLL